MAETHYVNQLDHRTRIRVLLTHVRGRITSFLIKLEYRPKPLQQSDWTEIARFDHNPKGRGHDITEEGLHVDVTLRDGQEITYWYDGYSGSCDLDEVISDCAKLFEYRPEQFIKVYKESVDPEQFEPPHPSDLERVYK